MRFDCIIIDFDHTIFDAASFKDALAAAILKCGVSHNVFWQTYATIRKSDRDSGYSPERHLAALNKVIKLNKTSAKKNVNEVVSNSRKYLYADTLAFLKKISSLGVPLILLSYGDRDFQNKKINACGLKKYFMEIKIVQKSKNAAIKKLARKYGGNLIFVNDNIKETREAVNANANLKPILKRRNDLPTYDYAQEVIPNFNTLKEIKDYIILRYEK